MQYKEQVEILRAIYLTLCHIAIRQILSSSSAVSEPAIIFTVLILNKAVKEKNERKKKKSRETYAQVVIQLRLLIRQIDIEIRHDLK